MPTNGGQPQAMQLVLERAATDLQFRAELLAEPRDAIDRAFGIRVPAGFRLKFIERDPDVDALVVLPDLERPDGELGGDALDMVSGGRRSARPTPSHPSHWSGAL